VPRPKVDVVLGRKAQKQLKKGVGILKVAKMLGLGTDTVQRITQEMLPPPEYDRNRRWRSAKFYTKFAPFRPTELAQTPHQGRERDELPPPHP
jgi:hypothetical protein